MKPCLTSLFFNMEQEDKSVNENGDERTSVPVSIDNVFKESHVKNCSTKESVSTLRTSELGRKAPLAKE